MDTEEKIDYEINLQKSNLNLLKVCLKKIDEKLQNSTIKDLNNLNDFSKYNNHLNILNNFNENNNNLNGLNNFNENNNNLNGLNNFNENCENIQQNKFCVLREEANKNIALSNSIISNLENLKKVINSGTSEDELNQFTDLVNEISQKFSASLNRFLLKYIQTSNLINLGNASFCKTNNYNDKSAIYEINNANNKIENNVSEINDAKNKFENIESNKEIKLNVPEINNANNKFENIYYNIENNNKMNNELNCTDYTNNSDTIDNTSTEKQNLEYFDNTDTEINNKKYSDNDTLLISELQNKVVLPYTIEEINKILTKSKSYKSIQDVIDKKYTYPLNRYKNTSFLRFRETYSLMRKREKASISDSIWMAFEMSLNSSLNPAIITACKNLEQLDCYLDYMELGELDKFNYFKIKYEYLPANI